MNEIVIKTSLSDCIDRLTILNVKTKKISDENKLLEITKEKNLLTTNLQEYLTGPVDFYCKILEKINEKIWDLLDEAKSKNYNETKELYYYRKQEDYNERRFRVKRMIDTYSNSNIKEQKGYKNKECIILTHLGLGDHIYHCGMIRYLATKYDKLQIVCLKSNLENLKMVFSDILNMILFLTVDDYESNHHYAQIAIIKATSQKNNIDEYFTGSYRRDKQDVVVDYPFSWYEAVNIESSVFWEYNYIPPQLKSVEIYNYIKNQDYAFIHNTCSGGYVFSIKLVEETYNISRDDIVIINPCVNIYNKSHKFYKIAEFFLQFKVLEYSTMIENAKYLMLSDSSFFGLAHHLNIKSDDKYYFHRGFDYEHLYSEKYKAAKPKHTRFKKININNKETFPGPYKSHVVGGSDIVKNISVLNN